MFRERKKEATRVHDDVAQRQVEGKVKKDHYKRRLSQHKSRQDNARRDRTGQGRAREEGSKGAGKRRQGKTRNGSGLGVRGKG